MAEALALEELLEKQASLSDTELDALLVSLGKDGMRKLASEVLQTKERLRQEEQLLFYQPVNEDARKFHLSTAKERVITGGNRSGKSETQLAETAILLTGIIPYSLQDDYPREKIKLPARIRLTLQSLTNTWEPVIKPKLIWSKWSGRGDPSGPFGHWGWIPRRFLARGRWDESWSEKNRTLTLTNGSTLQIMSYDQDPEDFSGASIHYAPHDEGPPHSIYRENKMRTIDVGGYLSVAMTPPDEESAAWDAAWVYDELYERGLDGPAKDPDIDAFTLFTERNRILDPNEIQLIAKGLSAKQKETRFKGRFLHLGGRIYSQYTDRPQMWCFGCNDIAVVDKAECLTCRSSDIVEFCHFIDPFDEAYKWPCVFLLDPHPRKPHMMAWIVIDPTDDWWQVAELEVDGEPEVVRDKVFKLEDELDLDIAHRLIDPNMGRSPAHNAGRRQITVAEEFAAVGIRCNDSVSDDFTVGKNRVSSMLKPDARTRRPRFHLFKTCPKSNHQMNGFSWDEWARYSSDQRDSKQQPRKKFDDFPKLFGYLGNLNPSYSGLRMGGRPIRIGERRAAY